VTDLAQAHVLALDYLANGGATAAVNLGTGHGHSVLEVIETARKVTSRDIPVIFTDRRPGDPPVLTAAADKARKLLGWQPRHTDLAETLRHAWDWHSRQAQSFGTPTSSCSRTDIRS
ncbi:MAG: UDP-glucose 4-epimerase GalE, partial [Thioalkalivibrio sp.]